MNNRTLISDELKVLAPGLAQLAVRMPYTLPQGYFENLSDNIINIIRNEDRPLPLLANTKRMPYQVPQGYFENLATAILKKVTIGQSVPEGYFDTLPVILLNKVHSLEVSQELETVAPLLNTISKHPVQAVPEGYFEQLQPIVEHTVQQQPSVISIKRTGSWLKYAAAASVVLLLSFGAYRYFDKTAGDTVTYQQAVDLNVDKQLAQLDDATIEKYLQENESVTETNTDLYKNTQETEIEDLLQNFTEQELQQQLLDNSEQTNTLKSKKT